MTLFMFVTSKQLKFIFIILTTILLQQAVLQAQSPDKILKRAIKSLGGERNIKNVVSYKMSGSIFHLSDKSEGKFLLQASQPASLLYSFDTDGFKTVFGFNGRSSWSRDSKKGLQTLTGSESRNFQAEANFRNYRWLNYKKDKSKIFSGGQTNINGKTADVVLLSTSNGTSIKMYFDKTSGLPVREEFPFGSFVNVFDYSDYRNVEGVLQPFTIDAKIKDENYQIRLDSVSYNMRFLAGAFDFPQISNQPLPDIPSLLKEIQANEDRIESILENYTYKQINTMRELGKDGVLREKESETYQLTFYKGYPIRRLIAKNSKPLSVDEQADEDKKVGKRVEDIEKEISKKEARAIQQDSDGTPDEENRRISIAEVLRASTLINPRRERFRGRDVVVFDFEPNPNFDFKNAKSFLKFFGKTAGVMWIDVEDNQVARLEAVLFDSYKVGGGLLASLKKGAAFTLENNRINDEVWLPSSADINLSVKVLLVKGINVNVNIKYSDYQKFRTEVKESSVEEIKKP